MTQEQEMAKVMAQKERFLGLCYKVFKVNLDGAELLKILKENLIEIAAVADPDKSDNHAFYREGQNSIIRSLGANIVAYEKVMNENAKKTSEAQ